MNDQFHLFQDENARCTTFRPGVQPNPQNDSLVNPKGAMSARKALGNITNNNGGFQTNIKLQQASAVGVGGDHLNNRKDVCLSESQMARVLPKESLSHKESQLASRIDDLISGGIEYSAGPSWEEQEALKELAMEDAVLSFDVTGHRRMVEGQIKDFCNDMIELDRTKSKVRFFDHHTNPANLVFHQSGYFLAETEYN